MYQWELSRGENSRDKKKKHASSNIYHASSSFPTSFESLGQGLMRPETIAEMKKLGFESLLPAQARCYSHIFKGQDAVLHSRTGTGKTLAFLLPLIERQLLDVERQKRQRVGPWMVVLVPTIELAAQIQRVVCDIYNKRSLKPSSSTSASASTLRCLAAGLEVNSSEDLPNCDVLVGTVEAVDRVIRLREKVPAAGNKGQRQQEQQDFDDEDSDDDDEEDEEEDDEEDLLEDEDELDTSADRRRQRNSGESRRRGGDNAASAGGAVPPSNAARQQQRQSKKSHRDEGARRKPTKRFVAAPGAMGIRALVIDEVDHTLGPKFSTSARRVKNMLRCIRVASAAAPSSPQQQQQQSAVSMQYVLVGATIPDWVQRVGFLGDPNKRVTFRLVSAGSSKLPAELKCFVAECSRDRETRVAVTLQLLQELVPKRVVVFAPTKLVEEIFVAASSLSTQKNSGDSNMSGKKNNKSSSSAARESSSIAIRRLDSAADDLERLKVIQEFNDGVANVLVCTDRASRGLDFVDIDTVLCTSFPPPAPTSAETFVHRAGRAGRVGKAGNCITMLDSHNNGEVTSKRMIESTAHIAFRTFDLAHYQQQQQRQSTAVGGDEEGEASQAHGDDSAVQRPSSSSAVAAGSKHHHHQQQQQGAFARCLLKVRNPFRSSTAPTRNARDVLTATLAADLLKQVKITATGKAASATGGSGVESVEFQVPKRFVEDVRTALWKFDFSVMQQKSE